MKPFDVRLQIQPERIWKEKEKGWKYMQPRTTYFEYVRVADNDRQACVPVLRYHCFDAYPEITVGFSTRFGGVSENWLSSMNLSFSRGDKPEFVTENHRRFGQAVGYDYKRLVFSDQVHDTKIRVVTEEDAGKGTVRPPDYEGIDGLITDVVNLPLMTFYADCVPLFFYDPKKRVVATAHSGWRGTVGKIGTKMIEKMKSIYGCEAADIICAIGPSICLSCYEVSEDVAEEFRVAYTKTQQEEILISKGNGKYLLDLHKACAINFLEAGVTVEHIAMPDLCTCCNRELLFSHRATAGKRGNLGAVIMLRG